MWKEGGRDLEGVREGGRERGRGREGGGRERKRKKKKKRERGVGQLLFFMFLSPVIKAASEKLSALSSVAPKKPPLSKKQSSGSGIASGLPSASEEILEAQKKRFEELKVQYYYVLHTNTE